MKKRLAAFAGTVRRFVGCFEVMHKTGEYEWEMSCGPYKTYEAAEKARQSWFKKDEIQRMRVVQFCEPNDQAHASRVSDSERGIA